MPHSTFRPAHRPERKFSGSSGSAVQGSQPMLVYPLSYNGKKGISRCFATVHTSLSVQLASGLIFGIFFPVGNGNTSIGSRFARVGDCTLLSPVNHTS